MHIVVAGEDEVALRITEALMHKHEVVFVGPDTGTNARLDRLDIQVVTGSPTSIENLREARIDRADYFIGASPSDELNIVSCLAAQRLGADNTICFLMSPGFELLDDEDISLAESIGIDEVLRPGDQLANEIVNIITTPGALDVRHFFGRRIHLLKTLVARDAPLTQTALSGVKLPRGVRLVMVQRDDQFFVPRPTTRLQAGDRVTTMGKRRGLRRFTARHTAAPIRDIETRRAIIVGGGAVGVRVANGLNDAGWRVKVIEIDPVRAAEISAHLDCLVLHGDGSDLELLEEERIDSASVVVAVTNNDEKNLLVSLLAKYLGVSRILTRADRLTNEKMFEKVGIDVVLSAKGAAIRSTVQDIIEADDEHVAELDHGDLEVLELTLPSDFPSTRVGELKPPTTACIGAVLRGRRAFVPTDSNTVKAGDHLLVVCKRVQESDTRAYFLDSGLQLRLAETAAPPSTPPSAANAAPATPPDDDVTD